MVRLDIAEGGELHEHSHYITSTAKFRSLANRLFDDFNLVEKTF